MTAGTVTTDTAVERAQRFDRRLLAPMMLGSILNPINSSIIAVALTPIAAAFGAPVSQTAWLISALYLTTAIGQPLVGRLVDMFGPKRLFLIGAAMTAVAGILGTVAPNLWTLVAARVILGFGTCAGYPAAMTLIRRESERTGMASPAGVLTALAITTQTIAVIGPTLGGLLIDLGGWRSTLAINVPLGVASLIVGALFLPSRSTMDTAEKRVRFDFAGVGLFATTLLTLLLFLMNPHLRLLWLLAVCVAAGAAFAVWELRRPDPFIDVRVFSGNVPLLVTYGRAVAAATVSYTFLYGYTQWLEDGRHLSASVAGLVLLPLFGVGVVVSTLTGRREAVRVKLIVGGLAQLVACALLLLLGGGSAMWLLVAIPALLAVPQGLLSLANQTALYHQAHPQLMGASAGLLRTFIYLGAMLASSATGLFFGQRATTGGLHGIAVFALAASAILLILTITDRSLRRAPAPVH